VLGQEAPKVRALPQGISATPRGIIGLLLADPGWGQLEGDGIEDLAIATAILWCTTRQDKGDQRQKNEGNSHMVWSGVPV